MGIFENLEEIRKKPEHIRMRYLFACVFVCMIFVLFLWIVSFQQNFENMRNDDSLQKTVAPADLQKTIDDMGKQTKEMKEDFSQQMNALEENSVKTDNEEAIPIPESNANNSF